MASTFFASKAYAVVGASRNPSKFGHRVFAWYRAHGLPVTPINPRETEIDGVPVLASLDLLPHPTETSISVITPPAVTLSVLKEATRLGIRRVWIQPDAEDEAVFAYVRSAGIEDRVVLGGHQCILVSGESLLAEEQARQGATKL